MVTWGNDCTWTNWTSVTTSSTSADTVWTMWTTGTSSTTNSITYATDNTWSIWVDSAGKVTSNQPDTFKYTAPPPPTPEELEARRLKQEQAKREAEERERERNEAIARARALLMSCLGPVQKMDYKRKGCFTVRSQSGKRYRLGKGLPKELDKKGEKSIASYCIHPIPSVPEGDRLLTEMLMLRYDEAKFLRIANKGYP